MVFRASQENDGTKSVVDATDSKAIDWQSTDHISVFDGVANRDFTLLTGEGTTESTFSGSASEASSYTALYPYQSGASFVDSKIISAVLPSTQTATPGSFDPAAALMMGVSTSADKSYAFKNCVAFIKVTIDAPAKDIKLTSYYEEYLAGTVTLDYNAGVPAATVTAGGSSSVTLVPDSGETIAAGTYYIAVLPQTMQFGFILSFTDTEGIVHNRVSHREFTSKRSVVTNMGVLNAGNTYTNRQIVYYAPEKFESFNSHGRLKLDDGTNNFVKVSAGTHEFSDGVGVITFDKDILEIEHLFYTEPDINNITKVIIPQRVTGLYTSPFGFSSVTELYIPRSVTDMDISIMPYLKKIVLPRRIKVKEEMINANPMLEEIYADGATDGHDAVISDGVLMAYAAGKYPTSYAVPDGITRIGRYCFFMSSLQSVTLPNSLTEIGEFAFRDCDSITSITIPSSVKTLEKSCFSSTNYLAEVNYEAPCQITTIPDYAFSWSGTRDICSTATVIGEAAYQAYNMSGTTKTDIVIPDNVKTIGQRAFIQSANIESVILGESVTSVEEYAFSTLQKSAEAHGGTAIDESQQTNLKYIYSKNPVPPTLDPWSFPGTPSSPGSAIKEDFQEVRVPVGSVDLYKNAPVWKELADRIVGYYTSDVTNLSATETANSYIVSEEGKYMFKTVQGNSSTSVSDIESVEVLWESFGTSTKPADGALVNNVNYQNGYVTFTATSAKGNAVIAAKDASGNILWSWHIWMTNAPVDQDYYGGATLMDRNLGATSATPGDVKSLGLFYQWGRKDPFLCSDGLGSTTAAKSTTDSWSTAAKSESTGTTAYVTQHPTVFIYSENDSEWLSTTDNTLWGNTEKTSYDPCPPGYRVPSGDTFKNAYDIKTADYSFDGTNKGIDFSKVFGNADSIWYPAAGKLGRKNGALASVGTQVLSWTAYGNSSNTCSYALQYISSNTPPLDLQINNKRPWGLNVRCQKIK